MRKRQFSEHQIIEILKAVEARRTVKTFVASMRSAIDENQRLKQISGDLLLEIGALKDVIAK